MLPSPGNDTRSSIEDGKGDRVFRLLVEVLRAVQQVFRLVGLRGNDPRSHVDRQLGLAFDEAAALEELAEDGKVAEEGELRDFLVLAVIEEAAEDDGFAVVDGDA